MWSESYKENWNQVSFILKQFFMDVAHPIQVASIPLKPFKI